MFPYWKILKRYLFFGGREHENGYYGILLPQYYFRNTYSNMTTAINFSISNIAISSDNSALFFSFEINSNIEIWRFSLSSSNADWIRVTGWDSPSGLVISSDSSVIISYRCSTKLIYQSISYSFVRNLKQNQSTTQTQNNLSSNQTHCKLKFNWVNLLILRS